MYILYYTNPDQVKCKSINQTGVNCVTSPFIVNELEKVLVVRFGLTKQGAKSRSRLMVRVAEVTQPQHIEQVSRDPNDDPILATAVTGQSEYIVTLDDDMLVLKNHEGVLIVTPTEFKEALARL